MATLAEQLASVQAAITAIEANPYASQTIAGRSYTRHDLDVLYRRETDLKRQIALEGTNGRTVCEF